jgi:hypothetical protein
VLQCLWAWLARGGTMWDLIVIGLVVSFFLLSLVLVAWGGKLR